MTNDWYIACSSCEATLEKKEAHAPLCTNCLEEKESIVKEVMSECTKRMIRGLKVYGHFNPETDKRDLYEERIEEQLDSINYTIMHIQRLKHLREKALA